MFDSAIDIGSNTVRLLVGQVRQGKVQVAAGAVITTRLAKGKNRKDPLATDAKERTLAALGEFREMLRAYPGASMPWVVATSALREAADGADFAREIQQKLGWQVEIIPGEEEARLSYLGASSVAAGPVMVLDVGGGSSELIWPDAKGRLAGHSVPVGAVRLAEHPLQPQQLDQALDFGVSSFPSLPLVGVGGTITTLTAVALGLQTYRRQDVHGYVFCRQALEALGQQIAACPLDARAVHMPMLEQREDIILPGLDIVLAVMKRLAASQISVSDAGILDGVLLDRA